MNQSVTVQPNQKWRIEKGIIRRTVDIIHLSATADETKGPLWIPRLTDRCCEVDADAERVLRSPDFSLSKPGTIEIAILPGSLLQDEDRVTSTIREMATEFGFTKPETDIGCILREILLDEDIEKMGFEWIVTMHESINIDGLSNLLVVFRDGGGRWLDTTDDFPGHRWGRDDGFAFVVAQVGS